MESLLVQIASSLVITRSDYAGLQYIDFGFDGRQLNDFFTALTGIAEILRLFFFDPFYELLFEIFDDFLGSEDHLMHVGAEVTVNNRKDSSILN